MANLQPPLYNAHPNHEEWPLCHVQNVSDVEVRTQYDSKVRIWAPGQVYQIRQPEMELAMEYFPGKLVTLSDEQGPQAFAEAQQKVAEQEEQAANEAYRKAKDTAELAKRKAQNAKRAADAAKKSEPIPVEPPKA